MKEENVSEEVGKDIKSLVREKHLRRYVGYDDVLKCRVDLKGVKAGDRELVFLFENRALGFQGEVLYAWQDEMSYGVKVVAGELGVEVAKGEDFAEAIGEWIKLGVYGDEDGIYFDFKFEFEYDSAKEIDYQVDADGDGVEDYTKLEQLELKEAYEKKDDLLGDAHDVIRAGYWAFFDGCDYDYFFDVIVLYAGERIFGVTGDD